MTGIDDYRQMAELFHYRDSGRVQSVPGILFKVRMPRSQDDIL